MTVFEKLTKARLAFQNANVKKSGKNKHQNYEYYELTDILPVVNKLADELKFACIVTFDTNIARLSFVDNESDGDIDFTCPMSTATLPGSQPVQGLGAVLTYIKRYLYQNCFEIVEHDQIDNLDMSKKQEPVDTEKVSKLKAELQPYSTTDVQKAWLEKTNNPAELEKALTKILADKAIETAKSVFETEVDSGNN